MLLCLEVKAHAWRAVRSLRPGIRSLARVRWPETVARKEAAAINVRQWLREKRFMQPLIGRKNTIFIIKIIYIISVEYLFL